MSIGMSRSAMQTRRGQTPTAKNRWDTSVVLHNGIRIQIGVTDRYVGQSYPLVDTTDADRIRTFAFAEIRMIGYLLFGRR